MNHELLRDCERLVQRLAASRVPDLDQADTKAPALHLAQGAATNPPMRLHRPFLNLRSSNQVSSMLGAMSDVNAFGLAASVLYVKFVATSMNQARKSFAANTRMAEDKQLVCAMGMSSDMDDKALKVALDTEQRWRRIVQNDLESIPLAFVVFWGAIQNGVDPNLTKTLLLVYTTARFGHTIAYGAGAARSRMACWLAGTGCILTAAANIAMLVLA